MAQTATECPDGAPCTHRCLSGCWRVAHSEPPVSAYGVQFGPQWPATVRRALGTVVQDGSTGRPPTRPQATRQTQADAWWGTRQGRILAFLHQYAKDNGYPPSIREIGAAVGLGSSSSVSHQLLVLEARGHIRRDPHKARAITLLTPPPQP